MTQQFPILCDENKPGRVEITQTHTVYIIVYGVETCAASAIYIMRSLKEIFVII